jgi:hypothetical protein
MADGLKIMALACLYIGLHPLVVFHADGYKGKSDSILENFALGRYISVPMQRYLGLAYDKKKAGELNTLPYPKKVRRLKET